MQRKNEYRITDLIDTSKKIKIISFYDNSVWWEGKYEDVPKSLLRLSYRMFTPRKNCYEFTI